MWHRQELSTVCSSAFYLCPPSPRPEYKQAADDSVESSSMIAQGKAELRGRGYKRGIQWKRVGHHHSEQSCNRSSCQKADTDMV